MTTTTRPSLFEAVTFGQLKLRNRIVMAPLTRCRADNPGRVPTPLMTTYYRQRASAGMILTEATAISPMGVGYPGTPGIWSDAQVEGWKPITDAVHAEGGTIVCQLWHVGRISDPIYLDGKQPVAPSAIRPTGTVSLVRPKKDFDTPRALEREEILQTIEDFRRGAENAQRAGFDGVEIHNANGYLPDQFLQDGSNHRSDDFGGSLENRMKFPLAVLDAAIDVYGAGRVGVHIAPAGGSHGISDSNPVTTFTAFMHQLKQRRVAFVCSREAQREHWLAPILEKEFAGAYIVNEAFDQASGQAALTRGASAVAYGKLFIANPDLPRRFEIGSPLNTPDPSTFYADGERGYTDYPALLDA